MVSPDIESSQLQALESLVLEKLRSPASEAAAREAKRRRFQDREAFLAIADDLLKEYGHAVDSENEWEKVVETDPVTIQLSASEVLVRVERTTKDHTGTIYEGKLKDVHTDLVFDDGMYSRHRLFSIDQEYNAYNSAGRDLKKPFNTRIKNSNGGFATNEEVERGRKAITAISRRLRGS